MLTRTFGCVSKTPSVRQRVQNASHQGGDNEKEQVTYNVRDTALIAVGSFLGGVITVLLSLAAIALYKDKKGEAKIYGANNEVQLTKF